MKLELKLELLKFCFNILNSIFLVLGLSVGGCALWILFDPGTFLNILSSEELRLVAAGLLVIGGVVMLVSISGCAAAHCEKRFLLLVYVVFIIVLILGQLFVTLLLLVKRKKIEQSLTITVDKAISEYGDSSNSHRLLDNLQHYAECCGGTGPADWLKNSFIQSLNLTSPEVLPCTCFRSYRLSFQSPWCSENTSFTEPPFGRGNGTFHQSCSQKLTVWLQENILTILGMDVGLLLLQIVLLSVAVSLFQTIGRKADFKRTNRLMGDVGAPPGSAPDEDLDSGEQNYTYIGRDGDHTDSNNLPHHHDNQTLNQVYQNF